MKYSLWGGGQRRPRFDDGRHVRSGLAQWRIAALLGRVLRPAVFEC